MNLKDLVDVSALVVAGVSAGIAIASWYTSKDALAEAARANALNKNIAKRQGVIDLWLAWQNVNEINPKQLIGPDVHKAANALSLTAALWNHDAVEKEILVQMYWASFSELYDVLKGSTDQVPGYAKRCRDFITDDISKAYSEMQKHKTGSVSSTQI